MASRAMANTEYFFTFWPRGSFRRVVYHYRNRATILALFATAHGVSPPREWMALHRLKQLAASSPGALRFHLWESLPGLFAPGNRRC
jgi:hypothetical protein